MPPFKNNEWVHWGFFVQSSNTHVTVPKIWNSGDVEPCRISSNNENICMLVGIASDTSEGILTGYINKLFWLKYVMIYWYEDRENDKIGGFVNGRLIHSSIIMCQV